MVEHGTVEVTRLAAAFGPRFEDVAVRDGRLYSNKAPGTALLTLPAHAAARLFTDEMRPTLTAMRLAGATLPLLLLGFGFLRFAERRGIEPERARTVLFMLLFATPLFAYGLLMFGHALTAAALFGAWLCLDERRDWLAGVLMGMAVASEYTAVFAAAVLIVSVAASRDWKRLLRVVSGGFPFAVLLGAYHHAAFGGAFRNPYSFSRNTQFRELIDSGVFGLHLPSPVTALQIFLHPTYGLLVLSPVLIVAMAALPAARKSLSAPGWWTLVALPAVLLVVYAGYPYWYGGWNVGPRFLVPALPFLVVPLLFRSGSPTEAALAGASVAVVALTTLVFPFVPEAFGLPWGSLAIPLLREGLIGPNLLHLVSKPAAVIAPFAIVLLAAVLALPRWRLAALTGAVLALLIGATWAWFAPDPLIPLQRAYIAEVYFEHHGALEKATAGRVPPGLIRRRAMELPLPPGSWPF